jgi:hypothetical protein
VMDLPPSHPDCERCKQIERNRFKKSDRCGVRCDCTSYCEEYKDYVMDRFFKATGTTPH